MSWSRSNFSKHYIQVILQGNDPENFLNLCMHRGIHIRGIIHESETRIRFSVAADDIKKVEQLSGNRWKIHISGHGGFVYRLRMLGRNKAMLIGLAIFGMLLYYQSLFIAEIQVNGYESINEQELRSTMAEAGFTEGCRKDMDLNSVKLHLYEKFDNVAWVGIKYDGNLARVTIAEGGPQYQPDKVNDNVPCNIAADREGYIDSIIPREGVRNVEDGAFVKKGTVLISGTVPLQNVAYGTEDEGKTETYVHASGTVKARIPVRLEFYRMAHETKLTPTGNKIWSIAVNDHDITRGLLPYKNSSVRYINLVNTVKPFKLKIQLTCTQEVTVENKKVTEKEAKEQVLNEIQQYVKENLPEDTQILNKSLNFTREKNIIKIGVTLETLQQIGIEEEIIIDKSNRKSEKDDNQ